MRLAVLDSAFEYVETHAGARRAAGIGMVAFIHVVFIYALVTGLAQRMIMSPPHVLTISMVTDPAKPETPPAAPPITQRPVFELAPPVLDLALVPDNSPTDTSITLNPQPALPSSGPLSIAATHTKPPYPALSRRLGEEGVVRLSIAIAADGSVAGAKVEKSSGFARLDEAAIAWVTGNWRYKPALADGKPVASSMAAAVTFELH